MLCTSFPNRYRQHSLPAFLLIEHQICISIVSSLFRSQIEYLVNGVFIGLFLFHKHDGDDSVCGGGSGGSMT